MLTPDVVVACETALARIAAAAQLAQQKADESDGVFSSLLGAESTVAAMRADVAATLTGYSVLAAKLERWRLSPELATADAVADFLRSASVFANVSDLLAAARTLDAGTAVRTIAADTAHDVVKDAAAGATAGLALYGTVAVLGLGGLGLLAALRGRRS